MIKRSLIAPLLIAIFVVLIGVAFYSSGSWASPTVVAFPFGPNADLRHIVASSDGRYIIASSGSVIKAMNGETLGEIWTSSHKGRTVALQLSEAGNCILVANEDSDGLDRLRILDFNTGTMKFDTRIGANFIFYGFIGGSDDAFASTVDGAVVVVDGNDGSVKVRLSALSAVKDMVYSPKFDQLVAAVTSGEIQYFFVNNSAESADWSVYTISGEEAEHVLKTGELKGGRPRLNADDKAILETGCIAEFRRRDVSRNRSPGGRLALSPVKDSNYVLNIVDMNSGKIEGSLELDGVTPQGHAFVGSSAVAIGYANGAIALWKDKDWVNGPILKKGLR